MAKNSAASRAQANSKGGNAPAGPRSSRGARTRERLVDAAKEIFEEHGFLDARISDIAERAGQSHGSFYYYFESKSEVFREVVAAIDERLFKPLDEVILAQSRLDPEQRVREAMRRHFSAYRQEARIMGLIEHVSQFDADVNALRLERHQSYHERVAQTIRQLQRRKLADTTIDPLLAAVALGALAHRFAERWFVDKVIDCEFEHAVEHVSRLCVNALRLKPPPAKP